MFVKPKPTQSRGQNIATNGAEWVETTLPDNLHPVLHSLVVPWPACCWFDNVASPSSRWADDVAPTSLNEGPGEGRGASAGDCVVFHLGMKHRLVDGWASGGASRRSG